MPKGSWHSQCWRTDWVAIKIYKKFRMGGNKIHTKQKKKCVITIFPLSRLKAYDIVLPSDTVC